MCFSPYWGIGRAGCVSPNNLLKQLFTLGSSKIEVVEACFCDTMMT